MSEFARRQMPVWALLTALGASACSSPSESSEVDSTGPVAQLCTVVDETQWVPAGTMFKNDRAGAALGVAPEVVADSGVAGPASCEVPIAVDAIGNGSAPVLSIEVRGVEHDCVPFGIREDPSVTEETTNILALCVPQE